MISVCIISNLVSEKLLQTIGSYLHCTDEVCIGLNNMTPSDAEELKGRYKDSRVSVFLLDWEGYGPTKNRLNDLAKNDWILSVDADESADDTLQRSLSAFRAYGPEEVYAIRINNYLGAQQIRNGTWGRGKRYFIRLFHKGTIRWNDAQVHESLVLPAGVLIKRLPGAIIHRTADNIKEVLEKNRHYAQLSAEKKYRQGKKPALLKKYLSSIFTFTKEYFFQLGILDGKTGFRIAMADARYAYWKYHLLGKKYH